ncbi:MAG: hypothetical protein HY074_04550 [Deltaproteobacteria bacterium]|nr:hypothetical protein [Deltaproteobacteria bacterium]
MAVLGLWASSIHLARRLLSRTVTESWSVLAARHALSKAPAARPLDTRDQSGSIGLELVVVWLPIIAIFGVILWLRAASLHQLYQQRSLDRCVFSVLKPRCQMLNQLSESNQRLRQLIHILAAVKIAKESGSKIPIAGIAIAIAGESGLAAGRAIANGIVRFQDALLEIQSVAVLTIWRCGIASNLNPKLEISRPQSLEAQIAGTPGPMEWEAGPGPGELDVRSWNLVIRSFGYCRPPATQESTLLDGESYQAVFRHADRPL